MIIALPIMQLFLFGFAINANPHNLPTGLLSVDHSKYERTLVAALRNTGYYDIKTLASEADAERALAQGDVLFVIEIPPQFDRSVDRGEQPSILVDADATDPSAIGNATAALAAMTTALNRDLPPILQTQPTAPPFQFVVHARYNPEQLTVLNVVPGLTCVILMMSTLFATTLSITRERERGTMENLLAMPVRPIEVMLAKIVPYVFIGYIQVLLITLLVSGVAFHFSRFKARCRSCWPRSGLLHREQPRAGNHVLDGVGQPDAGDPIRAVHADAVIPALGLHVSVPWHADLGAMGRRDFPPPPMRCGSCAACCSKATACPKSCRSSGRSSPSRWSWSRSRYGSIARPWISDRHPRVTATWNHYAIGSKRPPPLRRARSGRAARRHRHPATKRGTTIA